jgi:heme/copper-type cytochrome/quinol oxidase subunit 2
MNTSSLANASFLLIVLVVVIFVAISAIAFQFNPHDGVLRRCAGENVFVSIYKMAISVIILLTLAGLISAVSYYFIKASYSAIIHS